MTTRSILGAVLLFGACSSSEPTKPTPPVAPPPPPLAVTIDAGPAKCATLETCAREFVETADREALDRAVQQAHDPDQLEKLEAARKLPATLPADENVPQILATIASDATTKPVHDAYAVAAIAEMRLTRAVALSPMVESDPYADEATAAVTTAQAAAKAALPAVAKDPVKLALLTVLSGDLEAAAPLCKKAKATDPKQQEILATCAKYTEGGAFAALVATGDISSGFDDTNIYGGLLGNEPGEMNGGFGFGKSGFGPGSGGSGWGTIGTGRYGSIGHGSGTGTGYGVGGGRGGMRGRSAAVPTISIGMPSTEGELDKAIIRRYVKRNVMKLQYCYEKALLADEKLSGTVATTFTITADGAVINATAKGVSTDVSDCIKGVIASIAFPKPKSGSVDVTYPFTFRPSGG